MLRRASRRAEKLGLNQVELVEADAESLPSERWKRASVPLLLRDALPTRPRRRCARRRAACGRTGAVGSTIVLGTRPLDRLRVRPGAGAYGPVGTEADLRGWLTGAGMAKVALDVRGVFSYFEAQKPG